MCGRFVQKTSPLVIARDLGVTGEVPETFRPRYNIAPSQPVLAVRNAESGGRELVSLRWGLIPAWAKGRATHYSMINARAETVAEKPAYRTAFRRRRILVPADAWYEWRATPGGKQPYCLHLGRPFAIAGLWERWQGDRETIDSCALIVCPASARIAHVHDRMPAILGESDYDRWLDPDESVENLQALLRAYEGEGLEAYPVSRAVNRPQNDYPELLERLADSGESASLF